MPHARYASHEIVRRGQALYDQRIRAKVEGSHKGEFLVLDIESGEYEIDASEVAALQRAKAMHPEGTLHSADWLPRGLPGRGTTLGDPGMITGVVTSSREAVIHMLVRGAHGQAAEVESEDGGGVRIELLP